LLVLILRDQLDNSFLPRQKNLNSLFINQTLALFAPLWCTSTQYNKNSFVYVSPSLFCHRLECSNIYYSMHQTAPLYSLQPWHCQGKPCISFGSQDQLNSCIKVEIERRVVPSRHGINIWWNAVECFYSSVIRICLHFSKCSFFCIECSSWIYWRSLIFPLQYHQLPFSWNRSGACKLSF